MSDAYQVPEMTTEQHLNWMRQTYGSVVDTLLNSEK